MDRAYFVTTLLMMVLTGVGVWTSYQVRLLGRSTLALDRTAWTWKGISPTNLVPFLDLSGISTGARSHVSFMQLRKHCNLGTRQNQKWPVLLGRHAE
jgi:hypothetical protein